MLAPRCRERPRARILVSDFLSADLHTRTGIPFTISDSTNSLNATAGPYGIPRYAPSTAIPTYQTGDGVGIGPNDFNILTLPAANTFSNRCWEESPISGRSHSP